MIPSHINLFDALISVLGAIGILPVILRLNRQDYLNPVETKLRAILVWLFLLFVIRVPYLGMEIEIFGNLTYAVSLFLGFSILLYFETLLRQHLPLWLKALWTIGFLFFMAMALSGHLHRNRANLIVFGVFVLASQFFVIVICAFRKRSLLARIENSILNANLISLILIGPLFLTDITTYGFPGAPRIGTIGGVVFAYISLYSHALLHKKGYVIGSLLKSVVISLGLTAINAVLFTAPDALTLSRVFILFLCLNLIHRIITAIRSLDGSEDIALFLKAIHEADKKRLSRFLFGVNDFFSRLEKKILRTQDFEGYNLGAIQNLFDSLAAPVLSIYQLQEMVDEEKSAGSHSDKVSACEQLIDLIEKSEMSHICRIHRGNGTYVLLHIPMVGYHNLIEMKTSLVADLANLMK